MLESPVCSDPTILEEKKGETQDNYPVKKSTKKKKDFRRPSKKITKGRRDILAEKGPVLGEMDRQGVEDGKAAHDLRGFPKVCAPIFLSERRRKKLMENAHSGRFPPGTRGDVSHQILSPHSNLTNNKTTYSGLPERLRKVGVGKLIMCILNISRNLTEPY